MRAQRRQDTAEVDDGVRAASDAYEGMPLVQLPVRRDAYKHQPLRPLGRRVHDLPLRRCPGCQSRNAAPIGYGPGSSSSGERRIVYVCNNCNRRHYADTE